MKKILVLGNTGMLGSMVLKVLEKEEDFEVQGVDKDEFDACAEVIVIDDYDYIINCIGILADNPNMELMKKVNAVFPHKLAKATKAKIISISTDGVFSGNKDEYNEDDEPDAEDEYGKSKIEGEIKADNVINIRTSIIGPSPKKKGLLEWFLSQKDNSAINGYTNHVWNGVTTLQYAELCVKIIKQDAFDKLRKESHVFHFAPNEPITKYELLNLFKKALKKNITINPTEDSKGAVKRILTTKYSGLKELFKYNIEMEKAVDQLCKESYGE